MNQHDISTELFREYVWPNGDLYRIDRPNKLFVKSDERGDSHRVLDEEGISHYVRRGWTAIRWRSPEMPVSF